MKIAQMVITKTQNGDWKLTTMSREKTEHTITYKNIDTVVEELALWMVVKEWEELSL